MFLKNPSRPELQCLWSRNSYPVNEPFGKTTGFFVCFQHAIKNRPLQDERDLGIPILFGPSFFLLSLHIFSSEQIVYSSFFWQLTPLCSNASRGCQKYVLHLLHIKTFPCTPDSVSIILNHSLPLKQA